MVTSDYRKKRRGEDTPKRWEAREKDNGWRLDYFLIPNKDLIKDSKICNEIYGSAHCPIFLEI